MENKWRELKIDNLPPDILTGDYEWLQRDKDNPDYPWINCEADVKSIIIMAIQDNIWHCFWYRKKQPKAPSHEEIMKLWWKGDAGLWQNVGIYQPGNKWYHIFNTWQDIDWFLDRKSADIPPEE